MAGRPRLNRARAGVLSGALESTAGPRYPGLVAWARREAPAINAVWWGESLAAWLSPRQLAGLCKRLRRADGQPLEAADRRRCVRAIDAFLREQGANGAWEDRPEVRAELGRLWTEATEREQRAQAAWAARPIPTGRPLRQRVVLVRARPGDINGYVTQRHYLRRGRTMAQLGYWIVLDAPADIERSLAMAPATQRGTEGAWFIGGYPVAGALHFALPRVSVPLYGYHPMELIELARVYLEPDPATGENVRMLASSAFGAAMRRGRLFGDWRQQYPNLPAPRAVVSWADPSQGHEGTIYKAAGFVEVGQTPARRPKTRRAPAGRRTGGRRGTIRHADTESAKRAYVLPVLPPPEKPVRYWLEVTVQGLSRAGARELQDYALVAAAGLGLAWPKRPREAFDYMADGALADFLIPLWPEDAGADAPDLDAAAVALGGWLREWVEHFADEHLVQDDGPFIDWQIVARAPATYTRTKATGRWHLEGPREAARPVQNRVRERLKARAKDWLGRTLGWEHDDPRRATVAGLSGRALVDALAAAATTEQLATLRDTARSEGSPWDDGTAAQLIEAATHQIRRRSEPVFDVGPQGVRRLDQIARAGGMYGLGRWIASHNVELREALGLGDSTTEDTAEAGRLFMFNHGIGRDSMAMMFRLLEGALVANGQPLTVRDIDAIVFSDTGGEWDHTMALMERVRALAEIHGLRFLALMKPPEEVWRPWMEEHRALRLKQAEGSEETFQREVVPRLRARDAKLAEVRARKKAAEKAERARLWAADPTTPRIDALAALARRPPPEALSADPASPRIDALAARGRRLDAAEKEELKALRKERTERVAAPIKAELKRLRDERKERVLDDLKAFRAPFNAEIADIKLKHNAAVRDIMREWRYTAPMASWAYTGDGPEERAGDGSYQLRPPILDDFASKTTIMLRDDKSCTGNHKVLPIRRVIADLALERFGPWAYDNRAWSAQVGRGERKPHVNLLGLSADETARLEKGGDQGCFATGYTTEAYPLVELGITKADEGPILDKYGYDKLALKSGCWACPHQGADWWYALSVLRPDRFAQAVAAEQATYERDPVLLFVGTPLPDAVAAWRAANPDVTVEQILAKGYVKACAAPRVNPCPECARRARAMVSLGLAGTLPSSTRLAHWAA